MNSPVAPAGLPGSGSVTDAFRAVVARHGARIALAAEGETLTYAKLDRLSNRVAHGLLERPTDEPVAMVAPLEPSSIVAMLGVLKAGRVCVPLDPRDPPEHVRRVREQLGALVVDPSALGELCSERDDDPALAIDPYDRSLVYFTSGSIGHPKGTVKTHKELTWAPSAYGITPRDRFAMVIPLAFAASGRDGLSWPHFDGLSWPHPRPTASRPSELYRARTGGRRRGGIEGGAVRADP